VDFLKRLFGQPAATASERDGPQRSDVRGELPDNALDLYSGPPREVVGESHYRGAIERAAGGARREGVKVVAWAALIPERDNPYDANAVAVHIEGAKVGHLSREEAANFRPLLERIAAANRVAYCRADVYGGWNRPRNDAGDYGITLYVAGPDRQAERVAVEVDGKTKAEIAAARPALPPGRGRGPGFYQGRHNSEWFPEVYRLRTAGDDVAAEELLLALVDATEDEVRSGHQSGVTPGGYEQLAILYRKRGDHQRELAVLERFANQPHAPGVMPAKLLERLEKVRARQAGPTPSKSSGAD
jgi:hypothetical protein